MDQGQECFHISLYEKHRVAHLTPDQKVADSIAAVRRNNVQMQYRLGMHNTPSCPVAWIPSIAGQI